MKKMLTLFAGLLLSGIMLNATVYTVSNNPSIPAQYTSFQAAIDAASADDTILVAGSPNYYGDITVNKRLVIFGAGHNNPYGYNTIVDDVNLVTVSAVIGASGSHISGLYVRYDFRLYGSYTGGGVLENVIVERCRLHNVGWNHDDVTYTNDTIRNCLIQDYNMYFNDGTYSGVMLHNNVFDNETFSQDGNADLSGVEVLNNIFLDETANVFNSGGSRIKNMIIENNIFYDAEPQGCYGCTFENNITYFNTNDDPLGEDNTGSGNIIGDDPEFTSYPFDGGGFTYEHDFTLKGTSPGLSAGTDGSDIGITGGLRPYTPGVNPSIPQVTEIGFPDNASSVKIGGDLNVSFKAKIQE